MAVHLIASEAVLSALPPHARGRVVCQPAGALHLARWNEIEAGLAEGDSVILIGNEALRRARSLADEALGLFRWVVTHECSAAQLRAVEPSSLPLPALPWQLAATGARGLALRPPTPHAYFGRDEMPRAELVPLVEAVDEAGHACAYPAVWLKHVAPSLVGGRFAGSNWYLFALDDPLAVAPGQDWGDLIAALCDHAEAPLAIADLRAHYSCCQPGETVLVNVKVANHSPRIAAARLELSVRGPDGVERHSRWIRRSLNGHEEVVVPWEFRAGSEAGLWHVQVELHQEDRFTYGASREATSRLLERAEGTFVIAPGDLSRYPAPVLQGRSLAIEGHDGFLAGTHYYPSSSWWDWAWRDYRPEKAERDLAEMARLGYRLVRVWIDPELDEQALRGFEAWLHRSAAHGIVSIICVFSQWARHLSYPEGDGMTTFEFMGPADYNVYSVQLKNIGHQQRYLGALAERWRGLPNVVWNLSNEAEVLDPDPAQVDARFFGDVVPQTGPLAGAAFFNRWADLMTQAVREAGAQQPILRGYGFITGGDCYLQNRSGDLLVWHHYAPPEIAGPCLAFAHPGVIEKPSLLEEFGIPTLDEAERLERYEGIACWAAAMGAAGACSYEWGVSWLTRELPYVATPLKDASLFPEPDPRWMRGQVLYSESWPLGSMGLCPWAASFSYGSIWPCTPFPTPAAVALGEVARFCADLGPPTGTAPVLLVVPMEWAEFAPLDGYTRQLDPTCLAIQRLAAAHVPFSVVQEDQLAEVMEPPKAVVFPASQPVRPETAAQLNRLAEQGAAVHTGPMESPEEALLAHAVAIGSSASVWCVRRGTREGWLYMLFAPEGPASVTLEDEHARTQLDLSRYALVETKGDGSVRVFVGRTRG